MLGARGVAPPAGERARGGRPTGWHLDVRYGAPARTIAEVMGREIEIVCDEERLRPDASEVERLWASNEKAKALLGWAPEYAGREGFRRGIGKTAEWFARADNLKMYKAGVYNI